MRTSKQIVFSPFAIKRQQFIPIIIISPPLDQAPRPEPQNIRRWTVLPDSSSCMTLQAPSQGVTKGARLALARKGLASGSFRLNCAETIFALDENGFCLHQRMDLDEELETSKHGLMEKPPTPQNVGELCPSKSYNRRSQTTRKLSQGITKSRKDVRFLFSDSRKRAVGLVALSDSSDSDSGGLAYSRTFSEGLCNFAEADSPIQSTDVNDSSPTPSSSLRSLLGAFEAGKKWFDSLKHEKSFVSQQDSEMAPLNLFLHSGNSELQNINQSFVDHSQGLCDKSSAYTLSEKFRDDGCTFNWRSNKPGLKSVVAKKSHRLSFASSLATNVRKTLLYNANNSEAVTHDGNGEILLSGSITIAGGLCLFAQEELSLTKFLAQSQNFPMHNDTVELAFS